ncbi:endonuclease/exonuclease/phosphatase family protein [Sphingobium sp. DEHP117]|uniref:endonuclease/exonuclease/phosphatase family protein n=1 Tax=Sphingobium sp. DEHP117 TaxID=2993436 RepID=UPI0027D61468|nr:endonuclease/exonuclease/phosphatase family protein [Sphingobium sp. DEHP117]MDQ4421425.1 endonuclease/exonuclease/phosphatase family protein [Sphingobium sp. DEHP117]
MPVNLQRPRLAVTLAGATAAAVQALCLLLIFGPSWPVLMMLSHGVQLLPMLGAVAMIILAWMAGWQATRFPIILSGLIWIAAVAWLMTQRTAFWPKPPAAPYPDRGVIRIVTFNAWFANHDPEGAARWILAQQPEAVILQEVGWRSRVLLTQLALQYPYVVTCRGSRPCSTVMLSRRKPLDMRGLAHGDADNRHALSAAIMRFPEYTLVGVHLSQPWPMGAHKRELRWLASELRGVPRHRLVVAGDFNATGWSMTMRDAASMLCLTAAPSDRASWPAPSSGLRVPAILDIDHALLGRGWGAARMERGPDLGSDHYPFVITLNLG